MGSCHVAVCLCDPAIEELPQLEYDLESAKEELRKKFLEGRSAPKKRKFDLVIEVKLEEETHKRNRKKVDYFVDKKIRTKKDMDSIIKEPLIKKTKADKNTKNDEEVSEQKKVKGDQHQDRGKDVTAKKNKSVDKSDPENDKEMKHEGEKQNDHAKREKKKTNKKIKA